MKEFIQAVSEASDGQICATKDRATEFMARYGIGI